jgi:hypothetical protein
MSIAQNDSIVSRTPGADHSSDQGKFVTDAAGTTTIVASATALPFGCLVDGENTTGQDSVALMGGDKPVYVKLGGTATGGSYGQLINNGTVQNDAGTGARVLVCIFLESGSSGERVAAKLVGPIPYAS